MRRLIYILRSVVVGTLVVLPAFAKPPHAPDAQYDLFVNATTPIFDKQTRLRWDRFIDRLSPQSTNWNSADLYCKGAPFFGRLPTVKELLTLLDEEPHPEYEGAQLVTKLIDPDAFGYAKTPVDVPYWTSTAGEEPGPPEPQMWTVDFRTGVMAKKSRSDALHYRCVKWVPP